MDVTPTTAQPPFSVCVFCAASDDIDAEHIALAAEVGTAIGRRGWTLITGGGSVSMMGAVSRAARAAGGKTVGVIPEALLHHEVADEAADELVVTADMRTRKGEMDRRSDAFLALAGGIGTLEELIEVWVARTLGMHNKPVVVLDPLGHYSALKELVEHMVATSFVRPQALAALEWAASVEEAMTAVTLTSGQTFVSNDAELLEFEP
jgi:uncharacterized protein (TIGR00730 family)